MINEKIIDAEFNKDDCGPFNSPITAYKAGFRTAERLAKIEVLEKLSNYATSYGDYQTVGTIEAMLSELKAGQ